MSSLQETLKSVRPSNRCFSCGKLLNPKKKYRWHYAPSKSSRTAIVFVAFCCH
jgi:hypothetical protein